MNSINSICLSSISTICNSTKDCIVDNDVIRRILITSSDSPHLVIEKTIAEVKTSDFKYSIEEVISRDCLVLSTAIRNLLMARDFLGLQLDHAFENITDDEFKELAKSYLIYPKKIPRDELVWGMNVLFRNINEGMDADTISLLLGCPIEQVEEFIILCNNDLLDAER